MTDTVGTASSFVSCVTTVSAFARVEMPQNASPAAIATSSTPPMIGPNDLRFDIRFLSLTASPAVQQRKHRRDEKERRDRRERESADHRTSERRGLLAAFAEAERHRHHADDHRE